MNVMLSPKAAKQIESDLTDEEKRIVAEGLAEYDDAPDSFISLADFKATQ